MILLIEYFQHSNPARHKEYVKCLQENVDNDQIKTIDVVISGGEELPIKHPKIVITYRENRPSYNDFFRMCNIKYPNQICIIANSDIIFTDLSMVTPKNIDGKFLALSRWDIIGDGRLRFFDREDSQDCWIFKTPVIFKDPPTFFLGKPGCDNRLAYMAWDSGYLVTNPGKQIITKHLHLTQLRNYTLRDTINGMHMRVKPTDSINKESVLTRFPYRV